MDPRRVAATNSLALKLRSRPEETGWGGKKTHDTVDGRNGGLVREIPLFQGNLGW